MAIILETVALVMRKLSALALITMGSADNCNDNCDGNHVGDSCAGDKKTFLPFSESSEHKKIPFHDCRALKIMPA
eukprot:14653547-Ditylum_brightwellii.AAC.2